MSETSVEIRGQSEMGYLLQALTAHLLTIVPKKCHKLIESWMDESEIRPEPKDEGWGMQLGLMSYEAIISIESFPFREFDSAIIVASVAAWIQDNDPFREKYSLDDPAFDVEPLGESVANIEFKISFIEPITVVEDENGNIPWRGKKYNISSYEVWTAEKLKLDFE